MKKGFFILSMISLPIIVYASARNVDAPFITTILEQGDGSRIELRYRAIYWEPFTSGGGPSEESMEGGYDTTISPRIGELQTNVQLRIGNYQIDPGRYHFGFVPEEEKKWSLTVTEGYEPLVIMPFQFEEEPKSSDYLSLVFTPGITSHDFNFICRYGNLYHKNRWTITGVPTARASSSVKPLSSSQRLSPLQSAGLRAAQGDTSSDSGWEPRDFINSHQIQSGTASNFFSGAGSGLQGTGGSGLVPREGLGSFLRSTNASARKKAGSGAFRRLEKISSEQEKQ